MVERYKFIMKEIDLAMNSEIESRTGPFQFMDVCCSPGGFSEYVLETCPSSKGIGISLPEELGGHIVAIDTQRFATPDRYNLAFHDVTTIAERVFCSKLVSSSLPPKDCVVILPADSAVVEPPEPAPHLLNNMDMMILDGSFLGGKGFFSYSKFERDEDNPAFNVYGSSVAADQALLVAQIIVMANNLKAGGTVFLRLSMNWNDFRNGVLCLLRRLFKGAIANWKPRSCHQDKISYYLACTDFLPSEAVRLGVVCRMSTLLRNLRSSKCAARLVPWPPSGEGALEEASKEGLYQFWRVSLEVYYYELTAFLDLVRIVKQYQEQAAVARGSGQQRQFVWQPCWMLLMNKACPRGAVCSHAHEFCQLHPFVQVAHNLQRGYLEWPQAAHTRALALRSQPPPKVLALRELSTQQAAIAERTRAEAEAAAAAKLATAAAATMTQTIAASAGAQGLLASFNPSMWNSQIKAALLQMIHGERSAGGVSGLGGDVNVLMADQDGFENDNTVLDDMQQAAMQASIAARNRRAVAPDGSMATGKREREECSTATGTSTGAGSAQRRAREKPAAEPSGPPTVSGYFTWLPGVSLCLVRDNGYTLTALKAFLGD
ncbi:hypothetical protein FOA52_009609 [Chlamydomonas sp. UWO 241]|nr:hypothetical protein FOA52_009609 [Chlamydomonas sp. UWO 241]